MVGKSWAHCSRSLCLALRLRVTYVRVKGVAGGRSVPDGGGVFRIRGKRERPSRKETVRWVRASIGRCFLRWCEGTGVLQFRGRYTEESSLVWGLAVSAALKIDIEGKEAGSLAATGFRVGGAHAIGSAARFLLYLP